MKRKCIFLSISLFIYFSVSPSLAQVKGDFIVTFKKDTIPVIGKINTWDNDFKCTVKGEDKKYAANEILYYRKGEDNFEAALVSSEPYGKKHWVFLLREDKGKNNKLIFLSQFILVPTDTAGMSPAVIHYCRRPGEKNYKIKNLFTHDDLIDAFSDCPQLVELLKATPSMQYNEAIIYYLDKTKCK